MPWVNQRTFCVFDIIGANGDTYNIMRDYKTAAVQWGVDVEQTLHHEKIASEDLKAASATPGSHRHPGSSIQRYTGSMDSTGHSQLRRRKP